MRAPLSWLREFVALEPSVTADHVAAALIRQGLEVEAVEQVSPGLQGPLVIARVLTVEELTEFKKPIRWVSVDAGEAEPRWMICGARNFDVGDLVVVVKPGAVLPGGFAITARETYGKVSNGMICSARELALSEDHSGIIVLPERFAEPGTDAITALGLDDQVLDVAVTPDRGYALSIRGLAREVATAFGAPFHDPALVPPLPDLSGPREVVIEDPDAADRIVLRTVAGFDPTSATPWEMRRRLEMCGMRSVSLAVDITNYVMLELGQPLHAFDDTQLAGPVRVRAARAGEKLETIDHVMRDLALDDSLIADDSGALALAGVMGGVTSEISEQSTVTTIEAAHFNSVRIARSSRRHRLSSEASRRFERGVDAELGPIASARAVHLLTQIAGGTYMGHREVDNRRSTRAIELDPGFAGSLVGMQYSPATVAQRLLDVGCAVDQGSRPWRVTPPSWRPDLQMAEDLVEEVARLEGYDLIPSVLPTPRGGSGLTSSQRLRRRLGMALAARGGVEVLTYPFVGDGFFDAAGYDPTDDRRRAVRLANPLSEEEPFLRTSLLSGLVSAAHRNLSRGNRDLLLFEIGAVFLPGSNLPHAPHVPVDRRPTEELVAALEAAIPHQPRHLAILGLGAAERPGWWGAGRSTDWRLALELADLVLEATGRSVHRQPSQLMPWHPGRCAAYLVDGAVVGHAGELHPRVAHALGLPEHCIAVEINLDAIADHPRIEAQALATMPVATEDIALVVPKERTAAEVEEVLRAAGSDVLESIYLFDRYEGAPVEEGKVSLAFALTFRAADRTLTGEELSGLRSRLLSAAEAIGARLR